MDFTLMKESILPILAGAWLTLELVVIALAAGFVLAVITALVRRSRLGWASRLVRFYVFVIRGTPLLVQMFLIYYGLGQFAWIRESFLWPVLRDPFWCAIIALTVNTTAYGSEIILGGAGIGALGRGRGRAGHRHVRPAAFPAHHFSHRHPPGPARLRQ